MSKADTLLSVLETVNEVRKLIGYDTVSTLDEDENSLILLRHLNIVMAQISDFGDWHEMLASASIIAKTSVQVYTLASAKVYHPVQRIYEVAYHTDRQSLYPITLELYNQYRRGGGTGHPRFLTIRGVDNQGNPRIAVHPQPGSVQNGNPFHVMYYRKPRLYNTTSMDDLIPFPANLVIQGLYSKALTEEAGGTVTKESLAAEYEFRELMQESLNRFNADTGTDIRITPSRGS